MGSKLYVGNLSYNVTNANLEQLFTPHGVVKSAEVIQDRDSGQSKGFGFVLMGSDGEAAAAVAALNGQQNDGRALTVNEAKPRENRGGPGGGGSGGRRSDGPSSAANSGSGYAAANRNSGNGDSGNKRY